MSDLQQICRWHYQPDHDELINDLFEKISFLSRAAIQSSGKFSFVLAGGSTPKVFYKKLVSLQTDWSRWHIYFGDERCLPAGDEDRNDTMAKDAWLNHVPIPESNIYCIQSENFEKGAFQYSTLLANVPAFDLVLLGLGEDGHTASLFPGDDSGLVKNSQPALLIHDAPKPPSRRITLSAERLSHAKHIWFLATGKNKMQALEKWKAGENLPAAYIKPESGVDIFTDQIN